ncbi:zinc-ribbon domain-containing protein [Acetobacter nitrogenifigens]|nr:zinc-ribbon domain-containing protein [Acetobacter nitrogenifigens]
MLIVCPSCGIKYNVPASFLRKDRTLKCSGCGTDWVVPAVPREKTDVEEARPESSASPTVENAVETGVEPTSEAGENTGEAAAVETPPVDGALNKDVEDVPPVGQAEAPTAEVVTSAQPEANADEVASDVQNDHGSAELSSGDHGAADHVSTREQSGSDVASGEDHTLDIGGVSSLQMHEQVGSEPAPLEEAPEAAVEPTVSAGIDGGASDESGDAAPATEVLADHFSSSVHDAEADDSALSEAEAVEDATSTDDGSREETTRSEAVPVEDEAVAEEVASDLEPAPVDQVADAAEGVGEPVAERSGDGDHDAQFEALQGEDAQVSEYQEQPGHQALLDAPQAEPEAGQPESASHGMDELPDESPEYADTHYDENLAAEAWSDEQVVEASAAAAPVTDESFGSATSGDDGEALAEPLTADLPHDIHGASGSEDEQRPFASEHNDVAEAVHNEFHEARDGEVLVEGVDSATLDERQVENHEAPADGEAQPEQDVLHDNADIHRDNHDAALAVTDERASEPLDHLSGGMSHLDEAALDDWESKQAHREPERAELSDPESAVSGFAGAPEPSTHPEAPAPATNERPAHGAFDDVVTRLRAARMGRAAVESAYAEGLEAQSRAAEPQPHVEKEVDAPAAVPWIPSWSRTLDESSVEHTEEHYTAPETEHGDELEADRPVWAAFDTYEQDGEDEFFTSSDHEPFNLHATREPPPGPTEDIAAKLRTDILSRGGTVKRPAIERPEFWRNAWVVSGVCAAASVIAAWRWFGPLSHMLPGLRLF